MAARYPTPPLPPPAAPGERVRVGIVSGFFRRHSNWKVPIQGWIGQLDRSKFAVYGYHTAARSDDQTALAAARCDRFVQGPLSEERWRATIRADRPHVLIYPEIGMDAVAARLAAQRLAPTQCNSWGHPETSGYPTLDYYLSSALMEPPDADEHYTERLVRLPNLSIYYQPVAHPPRAIDRAELGLRPQATVFWCGQALHKYLPQFDSVFPRIARDAGDCQFVFIQHHNQPVTEQFQARIRRAFAAFGLNADGFNVFLPRLNWSRFFGAIGQCDIILDSIGWSGCNSTLEALEHSLPLVTWAGPLMRGRHGAAILNLLDATETIAATVDGYVAIAIRLARDAPWRTALRDRIAAQKSRLYRDSACISALEEFLDRVARTGAPERPPASRSC